MIAFFDAAGGGVACVRGEPRARLRVLLRVNPQESRGGLSLTPSCRRIQVRSEFGISVWRGTGAQRFLAGLK